MRKATALPKTGTEKQTPDHLDLSIPEESDLQGAKLSMLTQSVEYKGILQSKSPPDRPTSVRNLQTTRDALAQYTGHLETDETLRSNVRRNDIHTKVRQVLYKAMHRTQKIGTFWKDINNFEDWQNCGTCGVPESMSHILTDCQATPIRLIWNLAKHYWPSTHYIWPEPSLGIILGCGSLSAQPSNAIRESRHNPQGTATPKAPADSSAS
jgi:hypothetical protein